MEARAVSAAEGLVMTRTPKPAVRVIATSPATSIAHRVRVRVLEPDPRLDVPPRLFVPRVRPELRLKPEVVHHRAVSREPNHQDRLVPETPLVVVVEVPVARESRGDAVVGVEAADLLPRVRRLHGS